MTPFLFKIKAHKMGSMSDYSLSLTPDDPWKSPKGDGLQVCQDEYLISQVLELLFHGKDASGRAHSIESACREVGIGTTTWYRWAKDGALEPYKAALSTQMSS